MLPWGRSGAAVGATAPSHVPASAQWGCSSQRVNPRPSRINTCCRPDQDRCLIKVIAPPPSDAALIAALAGRREGQAGCPQTAPSSAWLNPAQHPGAAATRPGTGLCRARLKEPAQRLHLSSLAPAWPHQASSTATGPGTGPTSATGRPRASEGSGPGLGAAAAPTELQGRVGSTPAPSSAHPPKPRPRCPSDRHEAFSKPQPCSRGRLAGKRTQNLPIAS